MRQTRTGVKKKKKCIKPVTEGEGLTKWKKIDEKRRKKNGMKRKRNSKNEENMKLSGKNALWVRG